MTAYRARRGLRCLVALFGSCFALRALAQSPPVSVPPTPPAVRVPGPTAPKPNASAAQPPLPPGLQKAGAAFSRAVAFQRARKTQPAIAAYQEFLRLATAAKLPESSRLPAYQNLAGLYQVAGDRKNFETTLRQVARLNPRNPVAFSQLATLAVTQRRFDEAKTFAARALQLNPPALVAAPARFALGAVAMERKEYAEAETQYREAVKLVPGNAQAHFNYGLALGKQKKYAPALAAMEKARDLAPQLMQARLYVAALKQQMRDYPGALAAYQEAVAREPGNAYALFNRALLLQQIGRNQEAITAYLDLLRVQPSNYGAHLNAGQLYYGIGNFAAARQQNEAALRLVPNDPRALAALAYAELQDGTRLLEPVSRANALKQAETHFQRALARQSADPVAQNGLAYLYERMERYDDALAIYRKRLAVSPDDVETYRQIARAYAAQRKADDIVATWRAYRARKPDDPTGYAEPARLLEAQGQWQNALDEWNALLVRRPGNGVALVAAAKNLERLQRPDEARARLHSVLALDATASDVPVAARSVERAALRAERADALRGLAQLALADSKPDEAVKWLEQVKALEAGDAKQAGRAPNPETYRQIAQAYEAAKQPEAALAERQALTEASPQDATVWADLGQALDKANRPGDAALAYRKAGERAKTPLDYRLKIADMYRRRQNFVLALAEYESLRKQFPNENQLLFPLAQTYEALGQDAPAIAAYDALLKSDPNAVWAEDRKATVLTRLKRYAEARALYEKAIERSPENYQAYADLGHVYTEEGRADAYLAWLQTRFEKTPTRVTLMTVLADAFAGQKREDEGLKYLRAQVEKRKTQRAIPEAFGALLIRRGRAAEALGVYRDLAARWPNDATVQMELGEQLEFGGKLDEAQRLYETQVARADISANDRAPLRRKLAALYVKAGRKDAAIAQYQEIAKADPNDFSAQSALAQMLAEADRLPEATPIYVGLAKQPNYPSALRADALVQVGNIYARQGRKADAIGQYREALKLNPQATEAASALKRLGEK